MPTERNLFEDPRVAELLGGGMTNMLGAIFKQMEIAEEEIADARGGKTERDTEDPLWGAFTLLRATDERMQTEFVYRAHCRELLARIRDGEDTRPPTNAELVCHLSEASMVAPLTPGAFALQMRLFAETFPEQYEKIGDDIDLDTYTRLHGYEANETERKLRRRLRQDWRTPGRQPTGTAD